MTKSLSPPKQINRKPKPSPLSLLATAVATSLALSNPAHAQTQTQMEIDANLLQAQFIEDAGGAERIDNSGKLRMLSQRIPASACFAHADILHDASFAMLGDATAAFDKIIAGLERGDDSIGMTGAETDRRVLMKIAALNVIWDPMHSEIDLVLANGGADADISQLAATSEPLLDAAKLLVSEIAAEYADPTAMLQSDALVIDIAGRQRMLSQRISKNTCLIGTGLAADTAIGELTATMNMFDVSAHALLNGMPDAGILAPDNDVVIAGLTKVIADWNDIKSLIENVIAEGAANDDQLANVFTTMNSLTGQMNTIVGIMAEDSKLNL